MHALQARPTRQGPLVDRPAVRSGAPKRGGELVCANHGATFADDTGECAYGPCEGARLDGVEVGVRDGTVYLADDDEFVGAGGFETDLTDPLLDVERRVLRRRTGRLP